MKLCDNIFRNTEILKQLGYEIPLYNREDMRARTMQNPVWLHFGSGNIFRAYMAVLQERLLNEGLQDTGIIAAEGYDYELIDAVYTPFDNLSVFVTLIPDGTVRKRITGSVAQSVKADEAGMKRLAEIFKSKSLQMVSLTITEKGYDIKSSDGSILPSVAADFKAGPDKAESFLGKLSALCLERFIAGALPLALVSMDNCSKNGLLLQGVVSRFADEWISRGYAPRSFSDYVEKGDILAFPCTMIDKITPYPDDAVAKMLSDDGFEDMVSIVTARQSVTAPFVNAEEPEYLVVEDNFPNGRAPLEKAGVIFTDMETVDNAERMKVCTCLNPLHTALSVFACLLGYVRVSDAMKDPDLSNLVKAVAQEGLEVVADPKVISPVLFLDTVLTVRLPNPYIPDTPQRIATDTSRKLAVRFGETIKAYMHSEVLDVKDLRAIPMAIAGWCRYLLGTDDNDVPFALDPDPMLGELQGLLSGISIGTDINCGDKLKAILSNSGIFGIDLFTAGLTQKITDYFQMMIEDKGAVRKTLGYLHEQ